MATGTNFSVFFYAKKQGGFKTMKVKIKKSIAFIMLILTLFSVFTNIFVNEVNATEIQTADLKNGGDCGYHLQFWDSNANRWSYIITRFVYYEKDGVQYPAYCLNRDLPRSWK